MYIGAKRRAVISLKSTSAWHAPCRKTVVLMQLNYTKTHEILNHYDFVVKKMCSESA